MNGPSARALREAGAVEVERSSSVRAPHRMGSWAFSLGISLSKFIEHYTDYILCYTIILLYILLCILLYILCVYVPVLYRLGLMGCIVALNGSVPDPTPQTKTVHSVGIGTSNFWSACAKRRSTYSSYGGKPASSVRDLLEVPVCDPNRRLVRD